MEALHAKFSPSKLPRIIACPGSVALSEGVIQTSSSAADEGTYLHEMVEQHLRLGKYSVDTELHEDKLKNAEYAEAVNDVLAHVFTLRASAHENGYSDCVETKVSLAKFEARCGDLADVGGTVDYAFESEGILQVWDWKFGKGVFVEPDSDQLRAYAVGMLNSVENAKRFTKVICGIGQPRLGDDKFRSVEYTVEELLNWMRHTLVPALADTHVTPLILNPSSTACRWCTVSMKCKARHSEALVIAQEVFKIHAQLPDQVSLDDLAKVLDQIPALDRYIKDLETFAYATLHSGTPIPGYKLVHGRSIRQWVDEKLAQRVLELKGYDLSELSEIKFFSPTKAEKALGKAAKEEFFTTLVIKPAGKLTVAADSDKREAVSVMTASDVFSGFTEIDQ